MKPLNSEQKNLLSTILQAELKKVREQAESIGLKGSVDNSIREHESLSNELNVLTQIADNLIEETSEVLNRATTITLEETFEVEALIDTGRHENIIYVNEIMEMDGHLFVKIADIPTMCIADFDVKDDGYVEYYEAMLFIDVMGEPEAHNFEFRIEQDPLYIIHLGMDAINGRTVLTS